jgi:hypothetical protein
MNPKKTTKGISLGIAQGRKLRSDMANRTMVLAHLNGSATGCLHNICRVPISRQRIGQLLDSHTHVWRLAHMCVPSFKLADSMVGEGLNRLISPGLAQKSKRANRKIVVGGFEGVASALTE